VDSIRLTEIQALSKAYSQLIIKIMKNIKVIPDGFHRMIAVLILASFAWLGACNKQLKAPVAAALDPGLLTTSTTSVVIDGSKAGEEAVKLSWSAIANSAIRYAVILTAGTRSDTVIVAQNALSKSFTHSELNNILVTKLGLPIGTISDIKAVVRANVPINGKTATSNAVTIKVTPAPTGPAYTKLWIVGDATPNGWDINNPNEMTPDPSNPFQFKYNEMLNAGEFKIPVAKGNWGTDFYMPPTNNPPLTGTAVKLTPGGNPDNKWRITTPGAYKILLNISSSPFIKIAPFTPFASLYMVGDATPAGWNIDNPTPMVKSATNPNEFTYTGNMNAGEFKIPTTTGNWGTDYFMPPVNHPAATNNQAVVIVGGNPDNKWQITSAGTYKITVNQLYETISIVKQ
jgi:hypothetical protein